MMFFIQTSNPAVRRVSHLNDNEHAGQDESGLLTWIVSEIFPESTEKAVIVWCGIPILLDYGCELAMCLPRIISMIREILRTDVGEHQLLWVDEDFRASWDLAWDRTGNTISVRADWLEAPYHALSALQATGPLEMKLDSFLSEWKRLLSTILKAIRGSGISLELVPEANDMGQLLDSLPSEGILYSSSC